MRAVLFFLITIQITIAFSSENIEKAGNRAVQFEVDGNNLVSGGTYGIAFKYWPTNRLAFRLGVKYDKSESDRDDDDGNDIQNNLGSSIQFSGEHQVYSANKFSMYWGLRLAYYYEKVDRSTSRFYAKSTEKSYLAGMLLGAEYWLNSRFSLSAYHSVNYVKAYEKLNSNQSHYNYDRQRDRIMTDTSRLILSVYF